MQLILPQPELEQAIKNYVNDLMNVKDGTEMHIDLKAGRGIDGFTATVDIVKTGATAPAKTVVPAPAVVSAIAVPQPAKLTPRAPVQPAQPAPVAVKEEEPELVKLESPEAPVEGDDTKSEQPEAALVEVAEETATAPAETAVPASPAVRRPLFSNLKKPE